VNGENSFTHANLYHLLVEIAPSVHDFRYQISQTAFDRWFDGDIAEIIIYDRKLTYAEINNVNAYLEDKYALGVSEYRGSAAIWVQVPELNTNTEVYVHWGNTNATEIPAYTTNGSTWASEYAGVWHFDSTDIDGSTPAAHAGVSTGTEDRGSLIGAGQNFSDGDQISIADHADFHGYDTTMSLWFKGTYSSGWEGAMLIDRRNPNGSPGVVTLLDDSPAGSIFVQDGGGIFTPRSLNSSASGLNNGAWHYLTVMYPTNIGTGYIYVDGVQSATVTVTKAWDWPAAAIELGKSHDGYWRRFVGDMDEFRVVRGFRSADWIKACYDSQSSPGVFARMENVLYWDTDAVVGLQPGDGTWSTGSAFWSEADTGSSPLLLWTNSGVTAYFVPDGTSEVTIDSVSAAGIVVNGSGYTLSSGTLTVGEGGVSANENMTIASSVVLDDAQVWSVAAGRTNLVNGVISGSSALTKAGDGQLTLSGSGTFTGNVTVNAGVLEVQAKSGDVRYEVSHGATLKIGYSTGGGYANTHMKIYGDGADALTGFYLEGENSYNCSGQVQLRDAPTTIRQYGTGFATIGTFDVNGNGIWCTSAASGSVIDENIKIINRGYGMSMLVDSGTNTVSGDLIVNGPLDVNHNNNGFYKRGAGTLLLNAAATADNRHVRIQGGAIICGTNNCLGGNAQIQVLAGKKLDLRATSQSISNVTFSSTAVLDLDLNGRTSYGQLDVSGSVVISNVTLNVTLGYTPAFVEKYFIIVKDGTNAVAGTFAGLPSDGSLVDLGSYNGTPYEGMISYSGDSVTAQTSGGNDVVIYFESQGLLMLVK